MTSPVLSYNEWDPLEEVIVGTAQFASHCAADPVKSSYMPLGDERRLFAGALRDEEGLRRAESQLDHLAHVLTSESIEVRRPQPMDDDVPFATPDFEVNFAYGTACPRDLLLVIGDEIIEAPMAMRARYFEFRAYRKLMVEYAKRGARWTTAPKPLLRDSLYRTPFSITNEPFDAARHYLLNNEEPVFEAACFARCGRDIFWQPDLVSNDLGAEWLQRHLGSGFRVHRVEFADRKPLHIDATLVPVRPGLALVHPDRPFVRGREIFTDNGWRLVTPPRSQNNRYDWVGMNLLMIDETTAVVEAGELRMIEFMQDLGCRVIPVPLDAVFELGVAVHEVGDGGAVGAET